MSDLYNKVRNSKNATLVIDGRIAVDRDNLLAGIEALQAQIAEYNREIISAAAVAAQRIHDCREGEEHQERRWQEMSVGLRKMADRIRQMGPKNAP